MMPSETVKDTCPHVFQCKSASDCEALAAQLPQSTPERAATVERLKGRVEEARRFIDDVTILIATLPPHSETANLLWSAAELAKLVDNFTTRAITLGQKTKVLP